jgi:hypothetical protein
MLPLTFRCMCQVTFTVAVRTGARVHGLHGAMLSRASASTFNAGVLARRGARAPRGVPLLTRIARRSVGRSFQGTAPTALPSPSRHQATSSRASRATADSSAPPSTAAILLPRHRGLRGPGDGGRHPPSRRSVSAGIAIEPASTRKGDLALARRAVRHAPQCRLLPRHRRSPAPSRRSHCAASLLAPEASQGGMLEVP